MVDVKYYNLSEEFDLYKKKYLKDLSEEKKVFLVKQFNKEVNK